MTPTIFATLLLVATSTAALLPTDYDVVVYGSSPAGIAAATASATLGLKVALFEPLKMIGGKCNTTTVTVDLHYYLLQ